MADEISSVPSTDATTEVSTAATADTNGAGLNKYIMSALKQQSDQARNYYEMLAKKVDKLKENTMAEVMTPSMIMGGGTGDGLFGGAGAGGLIGGLILGSLLRNGRGGFLGDGVDGGAVVAGGGAVTAQGLADMSLMQAIGAVDKAVAVSTAAMESSQATQTLGITTQLNNITGSLAARIDGLKDIISGNTVALMQGQNAIQQNIMENRYELSKDISSDGEKTRALITAQYEMTLNRQLTDANNQIIELRGDQRLATATRGIEVNTTNNINQMQAQQQQQQQFAAIANGLNLLAANIQSIRSTNEAINVGSGTLTANPTNTNTNIR